MFNLGGQEGNPRDPAYPARPAPSGGERPTQPLNMSILQQMLAQGIAKPSTSAPQQQPAQPTTYQQTQRPAGNGGGVSTGLYVPPGQNPGQQQAQAPQMNAQQTAQLNSMGGGGDPYGMRAAQGAYGSGGYGSQNKNPYTS